MLYNPPFSSSTNMETILIPGAEIYYEKNFLSPEEATILFNVLLAKCTGNGAEPHLTMPCLGMKPTMAIREPTTHIHGATTSRSPGFRNCSPSNTRVEEVTLGVAYANSGLQMLGYNAVLCNLYQNGNDSVGLHADAEPEKGAGDRFCQSGS
jgi:hypothetical protein